VRARLFFDLSAILPHCTHCSRISRPHAAPRTPFSVRFLQCPCRMLIGACTHMPELTSLPAPSLYLSLPLPLPLLSPPPPSSRPSPSLSHAPISSPLTLYVSLSFSRAPLSSLPLPSPPSITPRSLQLPSGDISPLRCSSVTSTGGPPTRTCSTWRGWPWYACCFGVVLR